MGGRGAFSRVPASNLLQLNFNYYLLVPSQSGQLIQPSFGRSADMQDWIADIAGVGLGIMLGLVYRRLRKHRV